MDAALEIADRLFAAIAAADVETVEVLYRDDLTIRHSWEPGEQGKAESLAVVQAVHERFDDFGYDDVHTAVVPGGFLRRHVMRASERGTVIALPVAVRGWVDGGQVYRIEEYPDEGQSVAEIIDATLAS